MYGHSPASKLNGIQKSSVGSSRLFFNLKTLILVRSFPPMRLLAAGSFIKISLIISLISSPSSAIKVSIVMLYNLQEMTEGKSGF